ncbi:1-(5-phosphoribosyl)-5-[(5-phosphoribosylamino)methylideneamino]imidazole-4-carboxamide isomerase [Bacteroidota bacterium]
MLEIIPAIDIIDGQAVRLQKGDYAKKTVYSNNPLEIAQQFESIGLKKLHLVDLDGAKSKKVVNLNVLENIATNTSLKIDFGGGIKSDDDIEAVFNSGAEFATIGSIAVTQPELMDKWINEYGPDKLILGADVKNMKIAISGWLNITDIDLFEFLNNYLHKGITQVICTDISKDGMLEGPSFSLYKKLIEEIPDINIIASGGISKVEDFDNLNKIGIQSAIIGKAYYDGFVKLDDLKRFI